MRKNLIGKRFLLVARWKKIAFYRFDERSKGVFNGYVSRRAIPTQYEFRYPKAGEENSKISIHLYDTKTKITQEIVVLEDFEYYLA